MVTTYLIVIRVMSKCIPEMFKCFLVFSQLWKIINNQCEQTSPFWKNLIYIFLGTQHNILTHSRIIKKNIPLLRVCSELIADPPADTGAPEWSATLHSLERTYTDGKTPLISPSRLQLHIIMSIYTLPNANGRTELGICWLFNGFVSA
jgi:hypothetical protein